MQPSNDAVVSQPHHAVLASRVFDGRRWHGDAAVLIEDGRIRGIAPWSEVPDGWPRQRLAEGALLAPG
jgi:N-acetylglucosamine-6-phosphate deacetylase